MSSEPIDTAHEGQYGYTSMDGEQTMDLRQTRKGFGHKSKMNTRFPTWTIEWSLAAGAWHPCRDLESPGEGELARGWWSGEENWVNVESGVFNYMLAGTSKRKFCLLKGSAYILYVLGCCLGRKTKLMALSDRTQGDVQRGKVLGNHKNWGRKCEPLAAALCHLEDWGQRGRISVTGT